MKKRKKCKDTFKFNYKEEYLFDFKKIKLNNNLLS